jgi:signal peptidase II
MSPGGSGEQGRRAERTRRLVSLSWGVALTVLLLDQGSKLWALRRLAPGMIEPLLPGLLQLQRVSNTGAAFSLFSGSTPLLGLVSLVVALGLTAFLLLRPPSVLSSALAFGFLLGGTVGNGLDRWRLGAVIDFLEFVPVRFPIFNIADIAINLAVLCFTLELLWGLRQQGGGDG